MARSLLALFLMAAPALTLLLTTGCEDKTVTVQQSEQRHETEPQMVSPGEEVVE